MRRVRDTIHDPFSFIYCTKIGSSPRLDQFHCLSYFLSMCLLIVVSHQMSFTVYLIFLFTLPWHLLFPDTSSFIINHDLTSIFRTGTKIFWLFQNNLISPPVKPTFYTLLVSTILSLRTQYKSPDPYLCRSFSLCKIVKECHSRTRRNGHFTLL